MTIFSRIFSKKAESPATSVDPPYQSDFNAKANQIVLNNFIDPVRVVICIEYQDGSKKLLHDSNVRKASTAYKARRPAQTTPAPHATKPFYYLGYDQFRDPVIRPPERRSTDYKMLLEMVFGNLPLQERSACLKIHTLKDPVRVMISKLFFATNPNQNLPTRGLRKDRLSFISLVDFVEGQSQKQRQITNQQSVQMRIRETYSDQPSSSFPIRTSRGTSSLPASIGNLCSGGGNVGEVSHNLSCKYIRWMATQRSQFLQSDAPATNSASSKPKIKCDFTIGTAIVLQLKAEETSEGLIKRFHSLMFAQSPLLEHILDEMVFGMDASFFEEIVQSKRYLNKMDSELNRRIRNLFCSPRLSHPAWFSLTQSSDLSTRSRRIKQFVDVMRELIVIFNTTKVFLNCLLTAVLSYHINWVNTVSPVGHRTNRSLLMKHHAEWAATNRGKTAYSAYTTQLLELVGSIGNIGLRRQSRTVITDGSEDIVIKLVYAVSYYIRSSAISSNFIKPFNLMSTRDETLNRLSAFRKTEQLTAQESELNIESDANRTLMQTVGRSTPSELPVAFRFDLPFVGQCCSGRINCSSGDERTSVQSVNDASQQNKVNSDGVVTTTSNKGNNAKSSAANLAIFVPLLDLQVCKGVSSYQNDKIGFYGVDGYSQVSSIHDSKESSDCRGNLNERWMRKPCRRRQSLGPNDISVLLLSNHTDKRQARGACRGNMWSRRHVSCGNLSQQNPSNRNASCLYNPRNKRKCDKMYLSEKESCSDLFASPLVDMALLGQNDMVDMTLTLYGGYSDQFVPELVLQGCSGKPDDVRQYLTNHVFPRHYMAVEAQSRAAQLLCTSPKQLSSGGSQYLLSSPSPPKNGSSSGRARKPPPNARSKHANELASRSRNSLSSGSLKSYRIVPQLPTLVLRNKSHSESLTTPCLGADNKVHKGIGAVDELAKEGESDASPLGANGKQGEEFAKADRSTTCEIAKDARGPTDVSSLESTQSDSEEFPFIQHTLETVTRHMTNLMHSECSEKEGGQRQTVTRQNVDGNGPLKVLTDLSNRPSDSEAVFIIADVESESVSICSSSSCTDSNADRRHSKEGKSGDFREGSMDIKPSSTVAEMLHVFNCLCQAGYPAEFCLYALEDYLQKIYFSGKSVHDLALLQHISLHDSVNLLNMNMCDLPLYQAVDDVLSLEESITTAMVDMYGSRTTNQSIRSNGTCKHHKM